MYTGPIPHCCITITNTETLSFDTFEKVVISDYCMDERR